MPEGQDPGQLECDADCERQRRRQQLASAFDIPDPDRHQPVMDRHEATYSPEVLLFSRANRAFVEDVRPCLNVNTPTPRMFCAFDAPVADSNWVQVEMAVLGFFNGRAPRHVFPPMRREQRRVAHEVGAAFRMATQSMGDEPQRHVRLFRVSRSRASCSLKR